MQMSISKKTIGAYALSLAALTACNFDNNIPPATGEDADLIGEEDTGFGDVGTETFGDDVIMDSSDVSDAISDVMDDTADANDTADVDVENDIADLMEDATDSSMDAETSDVSDATDTADAEIDTDIETAGTIVLTGENLDSRVEAGERGQYLGRFRADIDGGATDGCRAEVLSIDFNNRGTTSISDAVEEAILQLDRSGVGNCTVTDEVNCTLEDASFDGNSVQIDLRGALFGDAPNAETLQFCLDDSDTFVLRDSCTGLEYEVEAEGGFPVCSSIREIETQ